MRPLDSLGALHRQVEVEEEGERSIETRRCRGMPGSAKAVEEPVAAHRNARTLKEASDDLHGPQRHVERRIPRPGVHVGRKIDAR